MASPSVQISPVDPNDPRLHTPEDEPKFRTAQGRRLHELGMAKKARRYDNCGQYVRWMEDGICDPWRENCSRCGLGSCPGCTHRYVQILLERYEPLGRSRIIPDKFYFLSWHDTRRATQDIIRALDRALVGARRKIDKAPMWTNFGMVSDRATMHMIYCGSLESAEALQAAFPGAHLTERPKAEFATALALTLAVQLSQDPYERAHFEHIFNGTRKLRISGISRADLHVYCGEPGLTCNSAECPIETDGKTCHDCKKPGRKYVPKCPKCGRPPIRITDLLPKDVKPDDLMRHRWHNYDPVAL